MLYTYIRRRAADSHFPSRTYKYLIELRKGRKNWWSLNKRIRMSIDYDNDKHNNNLVCTLIIVAIIRFELFL